MKLLLVGAGNLGSALLKGLKGFNLTVVERDKNKIETLKEKFPETTFWPYDENIDISDFIVLLAVKPQSYKNIIFRNKAKAIISVMAGVKLENLKDYFRAEFYIRAMPNIAALYGKSMTAFTGDEKFKIDAEKILSSVGKAVWVGSEKEIDIATAVAGSGPAFLALVADAISDGAVKAGMSKTTALEFTQGLFEGSAELLKHKHPATIKDEVTSPGGTTAEGLAKLEEMGTRSAFLEAILSAYNKANK